MSGVRLRPSEVLAGYEAVTLIRSLVEVWNDDANGLTVSDLTVVNEHGEVVFTAKRVDALDDWLIEVGYSADDSADDCPPHGIERPQLQSRDLRPGDVIKMADTGTRYTLGERSADDAGWWTFEGGWFNDAFFDHRRWERVEP